MNNKVFSLLPALLLVGCAIPNKMPPIVSGQTKTVSVAAEGIQKHGAYPNDVVWIDIFASDAKEGDERIGVYRLTTDEPSGALTLDSSLSYLLHFYSIESHFGGFSSCHTSMLTLPEIVKFTYSTKKSACGLEASDSAGMGVGKAIGKVGGGVTFTAKPY